MITLYIDTSNNKEITVVLNAKGKKYEKKLAQDKTRAEEVLELIDGILKEADIEIGSLELIEVNKGPGSFTGLRVGVAIANTLSFALGIPVNGKMVGEIEIPTYNAL